MTWAQENAALTRNGKLFVSAPDGDGQGDANAAGTTIVFLGTGASCGVPVWYCDCKACREAERDPRARRTNASIAVIRNEVTLIDAAPEVHQQLQRERICDVDRILFTHEHNDHVGGLPQLEYYVRLRSKQPIPFYCNYQTASYLKAHFDFMDDTFTMDEVEAGTVLQFDGITYTAVSAQHCAGALGYLIDVPAQCTRDGVAKRVGYLPDTARPCDQTLDALRGVDVLIMDATFNGGNWMPTRHLSIDDTVALADELQVGHAYLTHLSMMFDEPITLAELDAKLAGTRTSASYDGLHLQL